MIANALDNKTEGNIYIKLTKLYVRKSLNQMAVTKKVINNNVSRYMTPIAKDTYTNIFGPAVTKRGRSLPPYEEVLYNASFVFANSHPSYGQSIRMPPNCKDVGGYWIDNQPPPLSKVLFKLISHGFQ